MSGRLKVEPDLSFIRELRSTGGDSLKKCYQCATCSVVCELSGERGVFPRKEMHFAQWGLKDQLMADPNVWLCHQCNDCSVHCPRGAKPGDVLAAVRSSVFRTFAFPGFMGRALASPKALLPLILLPVLICLGVILFNDGLGFNIEPPPTGTKGGFFHHFLPHHILDPLFIAGNLVIFLFAAIGLMRFWKGLKGATAGYVAPSFVSSLIGTVMEILLHGKFRSCDVNKPRATAHMLVIFGFAGAMATTAFAFLMILLDIHPPIPFFHPVKVLGNLSAAALVVGCLMLIARKLTDGKNSGANGYADWLFLIVLTVVSLSGGLAQLFRQTGPYQLAYIIYFVHIVGVFFLLWYAPYSKFAHMFYRTLALVYARSIRPGAGQSAGGAAASGSGGIEAA
jgi:quinone-modifying oxidoreductase, subunit QmoC